MAAEAGYHGLCIDPAVHEIEDCRTLKPLFRQYGLRCMVNAFPAAIEELAPLLDLALELDARLVNVIAHVMPLRVEEGVTVVRRWMRDAERAVALRVGEKRAQEPVIEPDAPIVKCAPNRYETRKPAARSGSTS